MGLIIRLGGLALLALACSGSRDEGTNQPCQASTESVSVRNRFGTLSGTLRLPDGCSAHPVAFTLSGSGPQDRSGNGPGFTTDMYQRLARELAALGVGSLRFDDPGIAGSVSAYPSDPSQWTYELELEALAQWLPVLRAHPRIGRVVLIGHSQGALSATLLSQDRQVEGIVLLAGAGRPAGDLIREQFASQLTPEQRVILDEAVEALEAGELAGPVPPPFDELFATSAQPYLRSWFKYDPAEELARSTVPALIVHGGMDVQLSDLDADRLAAARPDAELVVLEEMSHPLKVATERDRAAQRAQYTDPDLPLHPELAPLIAGFVRGR